MLTEIIDKEYIANYRIEQAPKNLSSVIDLFYERHITTKPLDRVIPNVGFSIIFKLSTRPIIFKTFTHTYKVFDHIVLPRHFTCADYSEESHVFGIRFKSGFFCHLLKMPQSRFDRPVSVNGLLDQQFIDSVISSSSFEERVDTCRKYFEAKLYGIRKKIYINHVVNEVVDFLQHGNFTDFNVKACSRDKFLSSKTLCRYFLNTVGLTPKQAYCILRTRKAIEAYCHDPFGFDTFDFGYYDYSHFYKEVRSVTGLTLSKIRNHKRSIGCSTT